VSSVTSQASWSFVLEDRGKGAQIYIDGRTRELGCSRAGVQLRCQLQGMWPGGHSVELRLPGAVLRRTALVGKPWPERPVLVRVQNAAEAHDAARAGADGVLFAAADPAEAQPVVDAAHLAGARAVVAGPASLVETAGADGVLEGELPPRIRTRFDDARRFLVDEAGSRAVAAFVGGGDSGALEAVRAADRMVEGRGLLGGALALLGPAGAIVDRAAFPLLDGRKRHGALRSGTIAEAVADGRRLKMVLTAKNDRVTVLVNGGPEPWQVEVPGGVLDLLGSSIAGGTLTLKGNDVALLLPVGTPDATRY
jgi:hypothetical protein